MGVSMPNGVTRQARIDVTHKSPNFEYIKAAAPELDEETIAIMTLILESCRHEVQMVKLNTFIDNVVTNQRFMPNRPVNTRQAIAMLAIISGLS